MKKQLFTVTFAALLSACASQHASHSALEQWQIYHQDTLSQLHPQDDQAIAVFYRLPNFDGAAANVYINQDYHVSLLPNGYSPVVVCANQTRFSTSFTNEKLADNRTQGIHPSLTAGKTHYFKLVGGTQAQPQFEAVAADVAIEELKQVKAEIRHTLPRTTSQGCEKAALSKTLSAGALWGIDKHSYADMLPQGKAEIAEFAEALNAHQNITRVKVHGFTDPEASEAYNATLSQKRANTVLTALKQAGVKQTILATGYGETKLLVTDCAVKHPADLKARAACNLPNRRVEIQAFSK